VWRAGFGRSFGPVVRQTTKWMNDPVKMKRSEQIKLFSYDLFLSHLLLTLKRWVRRPIIFTDSTWFFGRTALTLISP
jgi:hypothetical protein